MVWFNIIIQTNHSRTNHIWLKRLANSKQPIIRQLKKKKWCHFCCNSAYYSTNNGVRLFCVKTTEPNCCIFLEWAAVSYCLIVLFAPLGATNVIFALYWQPCGVVVHSYIFAAHLSEIELWLSFFVRNRHCPVLSVDSIRSINISTIFLQFLQFFP